MRRRPRVLVLSTQAPVPVDRGDRNRMFHVLQLLADVADVRLAFLERTWEPPGASADLASIEMVGLPTSRSQVMRQMALAMLTGRPHIAFRFYSAAAKSFFAREVRDFQPDVQWACQISTATFLEFKRGRSVVDIVDSPSRYVNEATRSATMGAASRAIAALNWGIRDFERNVAQRADTVLVNSDPDRAHLSVLAPGADVRVLPNCVPEELLARSWHARAGDHPRFLSVGNLAYPPYRAAVSRFIRRVFPSIRHRLPTAELVIAGAHAARIQAVADSQPGVTLSGYVPDLYSLYEAADALISPHTVVMGLQYKVAEAMAIGLPVVGSTSITKASPLVNGTHVLVGETDQDIADCAVRIVTDRSLAAQLSSNAKRLIASSFTWEHQRGLIENLLFGELATESPH